jgi:hypothetical protein
LVDEQGLLGLVEEDDGIVLMVEEAEVPVRVVWAKAPSNINESAVVAIKITSMSVLLTKWGRAGQCLWQARSDPDDHSVFFSAKRLRFISTSFQFVDIQVIRSLRPFFQNGICARRRVRGLTDVAMVGAAGF